MSENAISKNLIIFTVAAFLVGGIIGGGIVFILKGPSGGSASGAISLYPSLAKDAGNNWAVKIDNYAITTEEYEVGSKVAYKLYKQQYDMLTPEQKLQMQLPDENSFKAQYLDLMLNQYIVTLAALGDSSFYNKETQLLLKMNVLQALSQLYLQSKMPDVSMFTPSRVEVDAYYKQNRAQLEASGVPTAKIIDYITDGLKKQKFQLWQQNFMVTIKEKFKVERNSSIIQGSTTQPNMNFTVPVTK